MILNILKVVIALGLVIFVHELGHFLVAKWAGVKCEKFYLGFDIFGLKLWKHQWGETEYGIGVLPLGGYVKMLGQEDNPSRLREEVERAKAQQTAGGGDAPANPDAAASLAEAERALYDPRSYLAQSVPKRMAIISAGVIMNILFAIVTAIAAYGLGVAWVRPEIGDLFPGEAAWRAGLQVGDTIESIKGKPLHRFNGLQKAISVGDIEGGVEMVIQRPGVKEPLTVHVTPDRLRMAPTIGIGGPLSTTLRDRRLTVVPGSAAARATPALEGDDTVVAIDGQPVEEYRQILSQLALHPDKPLKVTVKRTGTSEDGAQAKDQVKLLTIDVPAGTFRDLGLVMEMGPITAIQRGSPAEKAGLKPGDVLRAIDGQPIANPARLPAQLRKLSEQKSDVILTIVRDGKEDTIPVTLRHAEWYEEPNGIYPGDPLSIPVLGAAYQVGNRIVGLEPGSPAAKARVPSDVVVVRAKILPLDKEVIKNRGQENAVAALGNSGVEVKLDDKNSKNWPFFFYALQTALPGSQVELELKDGQKFTLEPAAVADWYNPNRGFLFTQKETIRQATSVGDAIALGAQETWDSVTMIFQLLGKLGSQVSPKALGGPVSIAVLAYHSASQGLSDLLIFLTMIGANLAVINFLPIPVLDGGHMVFLTYEGIRGKPPGERIHLALSYLGLLFILGLMVFVLGLDIQRLLPGG
jgi:regulator of sigma E protease